MKQGSRPTPKPGPKPASKLSEKAVTRNLALNRQAGHYYHLLEKFEAGIELSGTEVKSIREGKANLKDSYAIVRKDEVWLIDCHVAAYAAGSYLNADSLRDRRLLLHRQEIEKLGGRTRERGLTIIPLRLYVKNNFIKCEIALAKGKTVWDQRETLRRRTIDRETEQAMREHRRKS
jgi:SsrA-binding protein